MIDNTSARVQELGVVNLVWRRYSYAWRGRRSDLKRKVANERDLVPHLPVEALYHLDILICEDRVVQVDDIHGLKRR
jgi:hypothetical protein